MTRRNWVCPAFLLAVCQKRASMRRLVEPGLVAVFCWILSCDKSFICVVVCFTTWCIFVVLRFFLKKTRYLPDVNGSYLPWLGLLHVSFFRSTERRIKLELGVCSSPLFECFGMSMRWIRFFWKVFVLWQLSKNKRYYGLWTLSMPELWSWISHSPVSSLVEI